MYEKLSLGINSMLSKLRHISKSNRTLTQNFTVLMSATVLSQLVLLASSPLLTRLYTPQDFGVFGLIMAITSILSILATGRYELAIMLPKDLVESFSVVILACMLTVGTSILVLLSIAVIPMDYIKLVGAGSIGNLIYMIPIITMVQSLYQTLYYWLNRQQQYEYMAKTRFGLVALATVLAIAINYTEIAYSGLVLSQILAYGIIIIFIIRRIWSDVKQLIIKINSQALFFQAKRYFNFPRYLIVAHSLEALSAQMPIILLNMFFNSTIAGYFALTQRVIAAPVGFIAKTMGDIIRERFSSDYRNAGNCRETFAKSLKLLTVFAIIPAGLFAVWAPALFKMVFGQVWEMAGIYAQLLAAMIFFQMIASPLSVMYMVAEKQKVELYLQIARVVLCFSAVYIGYRFAQSDQLAVMLFGIVMSFIYIFMIYQSRKWSCNP